MVYNIKEQHKEAKNRANMHDDERGEGTDDRSVHVRPTARSLFPAAVVCGTYVTDFY
jgi:hypothetical protein